MTVKTMKYLEIIDKGVSEVETAYQHLQKPKNSNLQFWVGKIKFSQLCCTCTLKILHKCSTTGLPLSRKNNGAEFTHSFIVLCFLKLHNLGYSNLTTKLRLKRGQN